MTIPPKIRGKNNLPENQPLSQETTLTDTYKAVTVPNLKKNQSDFRIPNRLKLPPKLVAEASPADLKSKESQEKDLRKEITKRKLL